MDKQEIKMEEHFFLEHLLAVLMHIGKSVKGLWGTSGQNEIMPVLKTCFHFPVL